MRIVSGKHKSRRILAPKNLPTRPTTDMAKEALFNILGNSYYFEDLTVLDLFAGIGSISLEFASRGTKKITSVDAHFPCTKFIKTTAEKLELPIRTITSDVFSFLDKNKETADIIFADPPYSFSDELFLKILNKVFENQLLRPEGMLIIEHSKNTDLSKTRHFSYSKKYGSSVFSFFEQD